VRSSRKLERETYRNVEVMWLMKGLKPDHKTIAEFRRKNIRPLQKLFHEFVRICRSWNLVGGELIAFDGTKIKASNNKKSNFSRKKLDARLAHVDEQIQKYLSEMEETDRREEDAGKEPEGLKKLLERKDLYESYRTRLDESGENELSTVDPDARLMGNNRGGVDMAYNVQSAVDAQNDLIVEYDVSTNPSDQNQLGNMVKKVQRRLKIRCFTALADKGFYNGEDLRRVKKRKVIAIVSKQKPADPKDQPETFHTDKFIYDPKADTYTCPMGKTLHPHSSKKSKRWHYFNNKDACAECPHRKECTSGRRAYRSITRSEYSKIYEETDKRTRENMALYKRRQQIVEHPFGTVKYTMHGSHFLLRTRRKVRAEVALLFLGYNLKRVKEVLGFKEVMARLDALASRTVAALQSTAAFMRSLLHVCKKLAA